MDVRSNEPVDVILIIGHLDRLPAKRLISKKLKLVIAISSKVRHNRGKETEGCRILKPTYPPDFEWTRHYLFHDECGGVSDGAFLIDILFRKNSGFSWGPPDAVRGVLGNALDHKQGGEKVPLPIKGQFNTSKGILRWGHEGKIVTNCVFNKTEGVKRSITSREMGRVLDYPEERTTKMTEELLHLLTQNERIPGKIVYSSLFSILSLYSEMESGTMSNMKKRQLDSTMSLNGPSQKRLKASRSQIDHLKDESPQLDIEDVLEDMDLELKQKDVED